jgi:hypothetical protein
MFRHPFRSRRLTSALAIAGVLAALCSAAALAHDGPSPPGDPLRPIDEPSLGLVYDGLEYTAVGPCAGSYRIVANGHCTHGPDPVSDDPARDAAIAAHAYTPPIIGDETKVECSGDGTSGKRVQVLYVHASDVADRFASLKLQLGAWALGADRIFRESAAETAGKRRIRFVHDSACNLSIDDVTVAPTGDDSLGKTSTAVAALGYKAKNRKYLMFVDAAVYCGIGDVIDDTTPGPSNRTNSGPNYARVDLQTTGCNPADWRAAHELEHTFGAVQITAPNWDGVGIGPSGQPKNMHHCTDDYDRMCQQDTGAKKLKVVCTDPAHERLFDCNHDDYFDTNPAPGTYLATSWNTADSAFLSSVPGGLWGFVRADDPGAAQYTPSDDFNQSSTNTKNTVARTGTGVYDVTFTDLALYGGQGGVASVTALGSSGEHCTVSGWGPSGTPDTIATVRCFDTAGSAVDSQFDASFVRPSSVSGAFAYLWADDETASSYTPSPLHQFNSTGATNTITRASTGDYTVRLPGLGSEGGTVKVTTFSATSNACKASSWSSKGKAEQVEVLCFDFTGAPVDSKFTLVYADGAGILANGAPSGYLRADDESAASYTPDSRYQYNSTGALNTVERTGKGRYTATFPGLGSGVLTGVDRGTVHVTSSHTTSKRCEVTGWSSGLPSPGKPTPLLVDVACATAGGAASDSKFVLQFTQ